MADELAELTSAGMKPTEGDIRCAALGHITRMAICRLKRSWQLTLPTKMKLSIFRETMNAIATVQEVIAHLKDIKLPLLAKVGGLF